MRQSNTAVLATRRLTTVDITYRAATITPTMDAGAIQTKPDNALEAAYVRCVWT